MVTVRSFLFSLILYIHLIYNLNVKDFQSKIFELLSKVVEKLHSSQVRVFKKTKNLLIH